MSRLVIACSLVAALTTSALADVATAPRFAQPPEDRAGDVADPIDAPSEAFAPDPGGASAEIRVVVDRATLRAKLAEQRAANLSRFRAYQRTGSFPSNTYQDRKLNVWLDEAGHLCAAATIIRASGLVDLVDRVAEQDNFIRLGTVQQGPLMDWILTSGLTQDEIAAIQEPFRPVVRPIPVEPDPRLAIDARLRKAEDARLRARYKQVDAMIVKNQKHSLDVATDRLLKHQDLAWELVYGGAEHDVDDPSTIGTVRK